MAEIAESESIPARISELKEKQEQGGFSPGITNEIAWLRANQYGVENETSLNEAKVIVYGRVREEVEGLEKRFGDTEATRSSKSQLFISIASAERDMPDPLEQEVEGVQVYFLNQERVKSLLFENADQYKNVADALGRLEKLHGSYEDARSSRHHLLHKYREMTFLAQEEQSSSQ